MSMASLDRDSIRFCQSREGSGKNVDWVGNDVYGGAGMAADAARLFR